MAEMLFEFPDAVTSDTGRNYTARAIGSAMPDGKWQGWIEFVPLGDGSPIRSARETTQPNRQDTIYWASGLTPVYLQGALHRAERPTVRPIAPDTEPPYFDGPASPFILAGNGTEAVIDPFAVYQNGEALLRGRLSALADWHLVNIIRKYALSADEPSELNARTSSELVETIVSAVRQQPARR